VINATFNNISAISWRSGINFRGVAFQFKAGGHCDRDRMVVGFSVPITTKVVSSNPDHGEVYTIQHYVIPPPLKLTATI
jgi:hypothetical protein